MHFYVNACTKLKRGALYHLSPLSVMQFSEIRQDVVKRCGQHRRVPASPASLLRSIKGHSVACASYSKKFEFAQGTIQPGDSGIHQIGHSQCLGCM